MSSRSYGPQDDPGVDDGDAMFLRMISRGNGVDLPPATLRYSENMRLGAKTLRPRKGTKALATDLELDNPPIILDFTLGVDLLVASITRAGAVATVTTIPDHGYTTGNHVAIEHANQSAYNGDFIITVTGLKTFTYAVVGAPATPATGTITCNHGPRVFEDYTDVVRGSGVVTFDDHTDAFILATTLKAYLVQAGEASIVIDYPAGHTCEDVVSFEQYESKVYLFRGDPGDPMAITSITRAGAVATVTTTAAHGRTTNDWVYIEGGNENEYRGIVQITVTGVTTFTYAVAGAPASPATGTYTARTCLPPLVWDRDPATDFLVASTGPHALGGAKIKLPPTSWALEFNRRLWLPFNRKQILGSDYSDAQTIDTNVSQTRIKPGTNDWLVGALGFSETRLLLAYRKSLHAIGLTITDLSISTQAQIQAAYGCVARGTLLESAGAILFLTDNGVARLVVTDQLNLIADPIPLSDEVQDLFARINWDAASRAVAAFHDNRYYIALPLDGSDSNNALFVYSFINGGGWESVDTFPGDFDIQDLHVADYFGRERLHAVTSLGALYLLEELEVDEFGANESITENVIVGIAHTRYLRFGTSDVKRFLRALIEVNLLSGEGLTVSAAVRNPDQSAQIVSVSATADDDLTRRPRIARRGVSCSLEITTTAGRPEVKSYAIESSVSDRSNKSR